MELGGLKLKWEIIFVEDKSTDETAKTLSRISKQIENSTLIYHRTNMGRGKTVSDGILAAKGEICGYLDVDCEVSPSYIPIFIKELEAGPDVVVGKRYYESGISSIFRVAASRVYSLIVKFFLKLPIDDTETGFKFFRRVKILPILKKTRSNGWFWDTEICANSYYGGLAIAKVPVIFKKRNDKKSTVHILGDSYSYLIEILKFSKRIKKSIK